jgi:hypothetical protein
MTQIAVVAIEDDTNVLIYFQINRAIRVTFEGVDYQEGSIINVTLSAFEVIQLQDFHDLSGTFVQSSKPVGVFSGNVFTEVEKDFLVGDRSHLVEQMIPVNYWGREYYLLPFPTLPGSVLKVVAAAATFVNATGLDPVELFNEGDFVWSSLPGNTPIRVVADEPILVAQFARSRLNTEENNDPALMLIPPVEQYKSWYTFATGRISRSDFNHYIMVVIDQDDLPGLKLDGRTVDQFDWVTFTGSSPRKVGKAISIIQGVHIIHHQAGRPFGAYVYGQASDDCAYAYPAGMCFDVLNVSYI